MRDSNMTPLFLLSAIFLLSLVQGLDLGYGGLPGERTPLTGRLFLVLLLENIVLPGSVWPPFPGAGQGYWAARAGFYQTRAGQRNEKINRRLVKSAQTDTKSGEENFSFVHNGNTRHIP